MINAAKENFSGINSLLKIAVLLLIILNRQHYIFRYAKLYPQ
jgi:hypothetical protein